MKFQIFVVFLLVLLQISHIQCLDHENSSIIQNEKELQQEQLEKESEDKEILKFEQNEIKTQEFDDIVQQENFIDEEVSESEQSDSESDSESESEQEEVQQQQKHFKNGKKHGKQGRHQEQYKNGKNHGHQNGKHHTSSYHNQGGDHQKKQKGEKRHHKKLNDDVEDLEIFAVFCFFGLIVVTGALLVTCCMKFRVQRRLKISESELANLKNPQIQQAQQVQNQIHNNSQILGHSVDQNGKPVVVMGIPHSQLNNIQNQRQHQNQQINVQQQQQQQQPQNRFVYAPVQQQEQQLQQIPQQWGINLQQQQRRNQQSERNQEYQALQTQNSQDDTQQVFLSGRYPEM